LLSGFVSGVLVQWFCLFEVSFVVVDLCRDLPSEGLALPPVVVSSVELSQFGLEAGQRCECDLRYQLPPEDLVVSFDLTSASWMIRFAVDRFDVVSGQLRLELLRDELFAVVQVHLPGGPPLSECTPQGVYRLLRALAEVRS
jgi:hypothetical protein